LWQGIVIRTATHMNDTFPTRKESEDGRDNLASYYFILFFAERDRPVGGA